VRALAGLVIVGALTWVALSLAPTEIASNEVDAPPAASPAVAPEPTPEAELAEGTADPEVDPSLEAASELDDPDEAAAPSPDGSLSPERRLADSPPAEPVPERTPEAYTEPATPRPPPPEVEPSGPFTLTLTHRAARNGAAGASTLVSVKANGPRSTSVVLYSGREGGPYGSTSLKARGGGRWEGWLKFEGASGDTIEYWIEADHPRADNTGRSGSRSEPHRIPLK
jgi:hypothetical protein